MLCSFVAAQENKVCEYLYIYRNDNSVRKILMSDIDSLVFVDTTPRYKAVDLGLPSGLRWAEYNVGATKPEESGAYYAWGETEEKVDYGWSTYKWCNGSRNSMTKYCTDAFYGTVDNKTVLDPEDDVAHVKWGGAWRMPTAEEMQELVEYCTWKWTTINGVSGYEVTGTNGNRIFLPATGYRNGKDIYNSGGYGYYWAGTLNCFDSFCAHLFYFISSYYGWNGGDRCCGQTVRPVNPDLNVYKLTVTSGENGVASISDNKETSATVLNGTDVTITAKPNKGYEFVGWFVGNSEKPVSTSAVYTFAVSKNVELVAKFKTPFNPNGYDYVDLGLPSGLKWAAYNVGATKPEEYGCYYAWGETEEKSHYGWDTYSLCSSGENTLTKYCAENYYGAADDRKTLERSNDVAQVKWGGSWRMPTTEELQELSSKCVWEWTVLNDVNGYKITGPNGNSIFLPAAGCRYSARLEGVGKLGFYMSGSLYPNNSNYGSLLYFSRVSYDCHCNYRYFGHVVRPVSE